MSNSHHELTTDRLRLIPFSETHLAFLHAHWTDPSVRRFLWDDRAIAADEAREVIQASLASFDAHGFGCWLLIESEAHAPIGFAGLREFGEPVAVELLYSLSPHYWGRGLATEACLAVLAYGFDVCDLAKIHAGADTPNLASFRVMQRLGMHFDSRRTIDGLETDYYALERGQPASVSLATEPARGQPTRG